MNKLPVNMELPQPKKQVEQPKFTVPDVTLMLDSDDSLIIKPGMNIPLRLSTPDKKHTSPYTCSPQTHQYNKENEAPLEKSLISYKCENIQQARSSPHNIDNKGHTYDRRICPNEGYQNDRRKPSNMCINDRRLPPTEGYTNDRRIPPKEGYTNDRRIPPNEGYTNDRRIPPNEGYTNDRRLPPSEGYTNYRSIQPNDVRISQNMPIRHENLVDMYMQNKPCLTSEDRVLPLNHMKDIDLYIRSAPVLPVQDYDIRNDRRTLNKIIRSNCSPGDEPFTRELQHVKYNEDVETILPIRKLYQESNEHYEPNRYESPKLSTSDREKSVRFECSNTDMTNSILKGPNSSPEKTLYSSPRGSTENHHIYQLYQVIQNQNEVILHLQKVVDKILDQWESDKPVKVMNCQQSSVGISVMTQTEKLLMTSTSMNTDMTINEVKSLVEFKAMKQSDCNNGNVYNAQGNMTSNKYKKIIDATNCDSPSSPTTKRVFPEVPSDTGEVTFYDGDDCDHRENNDRVEQQKENQSNCYASKPSHVSDKYQSEESGKTFYNFMINIQQILQQQRHGKDRMEDMELVDNSPNNQRNKNEMDRLEDMKQQLMQYQNSFIDLAAMSDRNRFEPQMFHGNTNHAAFKSEANRHCSPPVHLTDGQLAAIAAASSKVRNHIKCQTPDIQFAKNSKDGSTTKSNQVYGKYGPK